MAILLRNEHMLEALKQGAAGRGGTAGAHLIPVSPYKYKQSVCQHFIQVVIGESLDMIRIWMILLAKRTLLSISRSFFVPHLEGGVRSRILFAGGYQVVAILCRSVIGGFNETLLIVSVGSVSGIELDTCSRGTGEFKYSQYHSYAGANHGCAFRCGCGHRCLHSATVTCGSRTLRRLFRTPRHDMEGGKHEYSGYPCGGCISTTRRALMHSF